MTHNEFFLLNRIKQEGGVLSNEDVGHLDRCFRSWSPRLVLFKLRLDGYLELTRDDGYMLTTSGLQQWVIMSVMEG